MPQSNLQELQAMSADVPNTDSVSAMKRSARRSASSIASWIQEQYQDGLRVRAPHARTWIKVQAILRGMHYFTFDSGGIFRPIRKKRGEIRAQTPIMEPRYRRELGRLNSNQIGVSSTPKLGRAQGSDLAFYKAERARNIITAWQEDVDFEAKFDEGNQQLLMYGGVYYHIYPDLFNNTVALRPVPQTEILPIPYDARSFEDADGIMRTRHVSKEWLELQDAKLAAKLGTDNFRKMSSKSAGEGAGASFGFTGSGPRTAFDGGVTQGSMVTEIWMRPNEMFPFGQWMFMVGDELFRFRSQPDMNAPPGFETPLFKNKIPLYPVLYTKIHNDFWGHGFCATLIPSQLEMNRQLTEVIRNARTDKPITYFDPHVLQVGDIQMEEASFVPMRLSGYEGKPPIGRIPSQGINQHVGTLIQLMDTMADKAASMDSDIIFGRQEGRTEGGPATNLLNQNAQAPLVPVIDRIFRAFRSMYPDVMDLLGRVWPQEKTINVTGANNMGREMIISRDQVPTSDEIILTPNPMMPGGRNAMMQLLFQLKNTPNDDGKGFMLKDREFRRSLQMLNMSPPGMEVVDEREQRIMFRIGMLINDGQRPGIPPADPTSQSVANQDLEEHEMAIDIIRSKLLDPSAMTYSNDVVGALRQELDFHMNAMGGIQPDRFDDMIENIDALGSETYLDAEEQSFNQSGIRIGA